MKRAVIAVNLLMIFGLCIGIFAQQAAAPNPAQQAIAKEGEPIVAQMQLLEEKLHGITEFQQYLQLRNQLDALKQRYATAGQVVPVKPKAEPAKPVEPKK